MTRPRPSPYLAQKVVNVALPSAASNTEPVEQPFTAVAYPPLPKGDEHRHRRGDIGGIEQKSPDRLEHPPLRIAGAGISLTGHASSARLTALDHEPLEGDGLGLWIRYVAHSPEVGAPSVGWDLTVSITAISPLVELTCGFCSKNRSAQPPLDDVTEVPTNSVAITGAASSKSSLRSVAQ